MNQMTLNLPQIDEEATKAKAEQLLDQYRLYLLQVPDDFLPKVTPAYSLVPPSFSNEFHSSTEDAALKRMDWGTKRGQFLKRMQRAVNRLSQKERQILVMLYMQNEEMYDYEVYAEMRLSQRSYYRAKAKAFYRLAFALRVEVYKDGGAPE
ncbi:ArpU family transcriptional regulator [Bacillus siamensis]|uniref:ArpU family phage packaging/lysis transcriptional regulator n=1 Tax=Bacillus TaxID=1386 RepID=UPI000EF20410|nr:MULTISPECIES: ArpU family phage packaging/lysis transcriptional regulator [Bacillus]AYK58362.1 ArpU family transcriptional regulator [Bacillus subtilis subsp. subtilis]MCZ4248169.1 ArpU family transcriptional regulator [Bacillus amyloliquefaciens]MDN4182222.1 ArpU family phage packaging/lysis transcriptional regulator [Bacillus subtilis]QQD82669.1 ArpU family transcriptional regulator [Bacillus siamensis]WBC25908.1 ArpU family transcriptional regulator [Bacillus subtilis]